MAENEVKVKITAEGADQAKQSVAGLSGAIGGLKDGVGKLSEHLKEGGTNTGLFSIGLDTIKQGLQLLENPIGLIVTGLGTFYEAMSHVSAEAMQSFERLKNLQVVMGGTAEQAERISTAFELAGTKTERMQTALFRLGMAMENQPQKLTRLGINPEEYANEGELLLALRDKISSIGDASTRSALLMQEFGRQGRAMAEAFEKPKEEFDKLIQKAEEYDAASPAFMAAARNNREAGVELSKEWEKLYMNVGTFMALPIVEFITRITTGMVKLTAAITSVPVGLFAWLFGTDKLAEFQRQAEVNKTLMEQAQKVAEFKQGKGDNRISEAKSKELMAEANQEFSHQQKLIKAQSSFEAERLKIQEGALSKGVDEQLRANDELVSAENARYAKVMDAFKRSMLAGGFDKKQEQKLKSEHENRLLDLQTDGDKLRLKAREAANQESLQVLQRAYKKEEMVSQEYLGNLQTFYAREKDVVALFGADKASVANANFKIENDQVKDTLRVKLNALSAEEQAARAHAAKFPDIYAEQMKLQDKLIDLGAKRKAAEQEADRGIEQSRKELVQKLKALADEEASIGASLEDKAIARLTKAGKTDFTQQDVAEERMKMGQEARETRASYLMGGTVTADQLRESRDYGNTLGRLQQVGSTPQAAMGMFESQQTSAYNGLPFNAIPTAAAGNAAAIQAMAKTMTNSIDKSVADIAGVVQSMFESFSDKLIRKMQFESQRQ